MLVVCERSPPIEGLLDCGFAAQEAGCARRSYRRRDLSVLDNAMKDIWCWRNAAYSSMCEYMGRCRHASRAQQKGETKAREQWKATSSDVCMPLISSTSFITGTGFMKCMPT